MQSLLILNTDLKHEITKRGAFILFLLYSKITLSLHFPSFSSLLALCFRMVVTFAPVSLCYMLK